MNIFGSSHTTTIVVANTVGAKVIFGKGTPSGNNGYSVESGSTTSFVAYCGSVGATLNTSTTTGLYRILQSVRTGNSMVMYVDGVAGSAADVTGKGASASLAMSLGAYYDASYKMTGSILYTRIDASALTASQLAADREAIQGVLAQKDKPWTFSRSTDNYMQSSTGKLISIPANVPRVGGDGGGVLIEGASTNLCLQSQTLGTTWTAVAAAISANGAVAPDGTTTVDGIVGDANDTQHGVTQAITLAAVSNTASIYAKPGNKNWVYISDSTVANAYAYFNILNGTVGTVGAGCTAKITNCGDHYRPSITFTGTAASHTFQFYSANADGDNDFAGDASTVNTWLWGAQVEAQPFPTSYTPTTTAAVARGAESLSQSASWLPSWTTATIEFEAKCGWSSSTDIGASDRYLFSLGPSGGGTTNDVFVRVVTDGTIEAKAYGSGVSRVATTTANPCVFSNWNTFKFVISKTSLALTKFYINGSESTVSYSGDSGAIAIDLSAASVYPGALGTGSQALVKTRNLRISVE